MSAFYQVTTLVPENRATAAAISPDGEWAAYANVDGIFLRSMRNGETKGFAAPIDFTVDRLAWFADGTKLLCSGFSNSNNVPGIWAISRTGAPPRFLRTYSRQATPSPDGRQIAFISQDWSEIWVMGSDGLDPRRVLNSAGDQLPIVFWLSKGRLGFQRHHSSADKQTRTYEAIELATGRVVTLVRNLEMSSAAMLPDHRLLYLQWDNVDRDSSRQLWTVKTNPLTGAFVGKPREIATLPGNNTTMLDLSASADGKRAMVLRRSAQNTIFVGDFDRHTPRITNIRRLTLDERTNYPHAWTADSRQVIFESDRNGNWDLFKQQIDRRTPESIVATPLTEVLAQLSPDGRYVLYAAQPQQAHGTSFYKPVSYKLMRVPVEGGTPQEVPIGGVLDEFRCGLTHGPGCVLRTTISGQSRTYYYLDPIRGKGRELARTGWMQGVLADWDVSPDGQYVALPNHDSRDARIRIVTLEPGPDQPHEREVVLPGLTNLSGLAWAAGGEAWFVSEDTTVGNRLLYVYLDGRYRLLGDIQGWAVPSPDGRHVAFMDRIIATNAWAIDRR